jgi:hypothetical protein
MGHSKQTLRGQPLSNRNRAARQARDARRGVGRHPFQPLWPIVRVYSQGQLKNQYQGGQKFLTVPERLLRPASHPDWAEAGLQSQPD